jgi:hypothetical protein
METVSAADEGICCCGLFYAEAAGALDGQESVLLLLTAGQAAC